MQLFRGCTVRERLRPLVRSDLGPFTTAQLLPEPKGKGCSWLLPIVRVASDMQGKLRRRELRSRRHLPVECPLLAGSGKIDLTSWIRAMARGRKTAPITTWKIRTRP